MNNQDFIIRREQPADYRAVEELTREAFWNIYKPGADEHYLVKVMRTHPDYIPELAFVVTHGEKIAANVQYMRSWLEDEAGNRREILSFGPLCVHPDYQRRGLGKMLLAHSFAAAEQMGYETVVIFGNPENYICSGFRSCKHYNICMEDGSFPTPLLVRELKEGALTGERLIYRESDVCALLTPEKVAEFDREFPPKEKKVLPVQELFWIYSHSSVVR